MCVVILFTYSDICDKDIFDELSADIEAESVFGEAYSTYIAEQKKSFSNKQEDNKKNQTSKTKEQKVATETCHLRNIKTSYGDKK
ncbi:hypothetical protein NQ314_019892 [Rhamnusium bicolor]|uniref:Uncharacterized protein n=1 Tax=Rhamnusium bicolor TaxID=1586634 RepID=A0AAV8WM87_9CUCU|nr:hypothetical protein NQ314_019892 [Rhamnusium bicolor]